jgi:hypothetical protein
LGAGGTKSSTGWGASRRDLDGQEKKVERVEVFFPERDDVGAIISQTLKKDPIRTHEEALIEIYRRLGRATRRRSTARGRCSRTCSSTRRSTTSRGSAA